MDHSVHYCRAYEDGGIKANDSSHGVVSPDESELDDHQEREKMDYTTDRDGDLILSRPVREADRDVITIEHAMETNLSCVGLQVWMGCLVLCNFILDNQERFSESIVLELGGGTGLASIVMATTAKHVICTDTGQDILKMCQKNIKANLQLYATGARDVDPDEPIIVRELDWTVSSLKTGDRHSFHWQQEDMDSLLDVDIIIAADVIYSNNITDAFFHKLQDLMKLGKPKTCYIATEKRLNFTLADLDVTCKEYDHYRAWLTRLEKCQGLSITQINIDFPQYLHCPTSGCVELWEIKGRPSKP